MISEKLVSKVIAKLIETAHPLQIILFGSYARGEAGKHSDLDILVIQKTVKHRRRTMVELQDAVRSLTVPTDILVASQEQFNEWADVPGTVFHEAKKEGVIAYDRT